jgi:hypothetical protein
MAPASKKLLLTYSALFGLTAISTALLFGLISTPFVVFAYLRYVNKKVIPWPEVQEHANTNLLIGGVLGVLLLLCVSIIALQHESSLASFAIFIVPLAASFGAITAHTIASVNTLQKKFKGKKSVTKIFNLIMALIILSPIAIIFTV